MISQRTWRWLAIFVVVDVVLVIVMLRHVSAGDDAAADQTPPAGEEQVETIEEPVRPTFGWIESNGQVTAWADRGDCSAGAPVVVTRDVDGQRDTLDPGVTEVLRLDVGRGGDLYVIGTDASCQPIELSLGADESEWVDPPGPIRRWHLTPGAAAVTTPAGSVDPGCDPVSLVSEDDAGTIACADGRVVTSDDDGVTWRELGQVDGVSSVVALDDRAVALAPGVDCAVAVHELVDGAVTQIGCVTTTAATPALLARSGDGFVAVVADALWRSGDARTWEPAG